MNQLLRIQFTFVVFLFLGQFSLAQTNPTVQIKRCFGGSKDDYGRVVRQTMDGGYLVAGYVSSVDGDVSGNHGNTDIWVLKLDASGFVSWKKCLGGPNYEYGYDIVQTTDGGSIVVGATGGAGGDVTAYYGSADIWVVKLSDTGKIQWQKTYGGNNYDMAVAVKQTIGGYIIAGRTVSDTINGQSTHLHDSLGPAYDAWVMKINDTGALVWQKAYGGSQYETANAITTTSDSGFIVVSTTTSNDGDVSGAKGLDDIWVIKINSVGKIIWQKCFGGTGIEEGMSVSMTSDGGIAVAGYTNSTNGDVTTNYGNYDFWLLKLNSAGVLQWQQTYGGSDEDKAFSLQETNDHGFVLAGYTHSNDGMPGNSWLGFKDGWIVKTDSTGNLMWRKRTGGADEDQIYAVCQTNDGGYITAGSTVSLTGDVSGNHGSNDYWVVKLSSGLAVSSVKSANDNMLVYPTVTNGIINIDLPQGSDDAQISILNLLGQPINFKESGIANKRKIELLNIADGEYILQVNSNGRVSNFEVIYRH